MAAAAFNNSGFPMTSRMKRKELTDDDFCDFSLSSPARKIRRLDMVDLPPIIEEVEEAAATTSGGSGSGGSGWNSDEERALVVYKPSVNTEQMLIHRSPASNYYIGSDFISGFKNHFMRPSGSSVTIKSLEEEEEEESTSNARSNMAVVPWVPSKVNVADATEADAMEAEEDGVATMDIEENQGGEGYDFGKGFPQWQQQHCCVPNLPYNTSTPISWFQ